LLSLLGHPLSLFHVKAYSFGSLMIIYL